MKNPKTVTQLVNYVYKIVDQDSLLSSVYVEGEVSNFRNPSSGHWYFSLKDSSSSIPCVMFAQANQNVKFQMKDGAKVCVQGTVTIYKAEGRLQILCSDIIPSGLGDLYLKLEELKKKLSGEGLFEEDHKKPIPEYPMNIALVTGNNTAAREDVLTTLNRRWPVAKVVEYHAPVQGNGAALKIIEQLSKADAKNHDVILLVRGGGSIEDLWCFNDENLARFVYSMHTPVVTGVGHETDTTLVDYVSDLRANTPTGAVEKTVPDINEVYAQLNYYESTISKLTNTRVKEERNNLTHYRNSSYFRKPEQILANYIVELNLANEKLQHFLTYPESLRQDLNSKQHAFEMLMHSTLNNIREQLTIDQNRIQLQTKEKLKNSLLEIHLAKQNIETSMNKRELYEKERLRHNTQLLDAYSPLKILERGYSIALKDNKTIRSIKDVNKDDDITIKLNDGSIKTKVIEKEKNHGK